MKQDIERMKKLNVDKRMKVERVAQNFWLKR